MTKRVDIPDFFSFINGAIHIAKTVKMPVSVEKQVSSVSLTQLAGSGSTCSVSHKSPDKSELESTVLYTPHWQWATDDGLWRPMANCTDEPSQALKPDNMCKFMCDTDRKIRLDLYREGVQWLCYIMGWILQGSFVPIAGITANQFRVIYAMVKRFYPDGCPIRNVPHTGHKGSLNCLMMKTVETICYGLHRH